MSCKCQIDAVTDWCHTEFATIKEVTARKEHWCGECCKTIKPGQRYERITGKWDGYVGTIKTCMICVEVRRCFFCTYNSGAIWDDLQDRSMELKLDQIDKLSPEARAAFFDKVDLYELED